MFFHPITLLLTHRQARFGCLLFQYWCPNLRFLSVFPELKLTELFFSVYQNLVTSSNGADPKATDASGNPILKDIGKYLRNEMRSYFKGADVKYIDPTYMIRAIPCASTDRVYCKILAHNAVHAAFAGYTGITVGLVNTHYVYLPIPVVIAAPRMVSMESWR